VPPVHCPGSDFSLAFFLCQLLSALDKLFQRFLLDFPEAVLSRIYVSFALVRRDSSKIFFKLICECLPRLSLSLRGSFTFGFTENVPPSFGDSLRNVPNNLVELPPCRFDFLVNSEVRSCLLPTTPQSLVRVFYPKLDETLCLLFCAHWSLLPSPVCQTGM